MEYFVSQDPRSYSYISIWIFDFGPVKLPGISRNGPLAPIVRKVDASIYWMILYPLDSAIGFPNTYSLGSDLPGG